MGLFLRISLHHLTVSSSNFSSWRIELVKFLDNWEHADQHYNATGMNNYVERVVYLLPKCIVFRSNGNWAWYSTDIPNFFFFFLFVFHVAEERMSAIFSHQSTYWDNSIYESHFLCFRSCIEPSQKPHFPCFLWPNLTEKMSKQNYWRISTNVIWAKNISLYWTCPSEFSKTEQADQFELTKMKLNGYYVFTSLWKPMQW